MSPLQSLGCSTATDVRPAYETPHDRLTCGGGLILPDMGLAASPFPSHRFPIVAGSYCRGFVHPFMVGSLTASGPYPWSPCFVGCRSPDVH